MRPKHSIPILLSLFVYPSASWGQSICTIAVNDYIHNGGGATDVTTPINLAVAMANRARSYGWNWAFANWDSNAFGYLFANDGHAGINTQDMAVFVGHGNKNGPFLGKDPEHSYVEPNLVTKRSNYKWSQGSLKWMVGISCEWLWDGITTTSTVPHWDGDYGLSKWKLAFSGQDGGNPNGSLHSIFASTSTQYPGDTGDLFMTYSMQPSPTLTAATAWVNAVDNGQYYNQGHPGVAPAILTAYQFSTGASWANEYIKTPWINPSACQNMGYDYQWQWFGSPQF